MPKNKKNFDDTLISAPVSWGELLDKITILEIKEKQIPDRSRLQNVQRELRLLKTLCKSSRMAVRGLKALRTELKKINVEIWNLENSIRGHEKREDFGADFVKIARTIRQYNDQRSIIKREINALLNSALVEEKFHEV